MSRTNREIVDQALREWGKWARRDAAPGGIKSAWWAKFYQPYAHPREASDIRDIDDDQGQLIDQAVTALSEPGRRAVVMYYVYCRSERSLCRLLRISRRSVRGHLDAAMDDLFELITG